MVMAVEITVVVVVVGCGGDVTMWWWVTVMAEVNQCHNITITTTS